MINISKWNPNLKPKSCNPAAGIYQHMHALHKGTIWYTRNNPLSVSICCKVNGKTVDVKWIENEGKSARACLCPNRGVSVVTSGIFKHSPPETKRSNYLSPLLIKLKKQFQPEKNQLVVLITAPRATLTQTDKVHQKHSVFQGHKCEVNGLDHRPHR